ncbi:MAG: archaemetzincin [Desulfarculaceae bacterium]|nr:archaemetzincin [Desulfarculaceae bacterium]
MNPANPQHPPSGQTAHVEVVPLGPVNQTAVAVVAANLQAILELNADVAPEDPPPEYALAPARGQYDASLILQKLAAHPGPHPLRLGLTHRDLCLPFLSHVFGEAQLEGRAAVVSLHRLGEAAGAPSAPNSLLLERIAKVALHETAHLLGLVHCRSPRCLMNFSAGLASLDRLDISLCPVCREQAARQRRMLPDRSGGASLLEQPPA